MNRDKLQKGWLVKELPYYTSDFHSFIGVENIRDRVSFDNIGKGGCNLTIAVLSMNRSYLTIRLMNSIKEKVTDFRGEFLIGDNGSDKSELNQVKKAIADMPFSCRIIEFGKNYGVAGGRNRLFKEVQTDWILSLDNDIYFTSNPLKKIQKDINFLGVKFLVMPLKDKNDNNGGLFGANIYVEDKNSRCAVGLGTALLAKDLEMDTEEEPFLCTAVPGTAVVNKQAFFEVGGFDEGMFVGFEDTEFSLRVFQKGYKVGCCGMVCLYHDHPKAEKNVDIDYEKERFSRKKLYEAATYFENKTGFTVWDNAVAQWIDERRNETGIEETKDDVILAKTKKKVMLVIDRDSWALDHVADEIIANLSDKYTFGRIYGTDIDNVADVFILARDYQIIHFMWRGHLSSYWEDYPQNRIKNLGYTEAEFHKEFIDGKVISTEVYDHLCLDGEEKHITDNLFFNENTLLTDYAVSSKKIWKIYNEMPDIRIKPSAVIPDGVNLSKFYPKNLERFEHMNNRKIVFGWVGNSKWVAGDIKGISSIIKPAIELLQNQGYMVELLTSDRQNQLIAHDDMVDFYSRIDCYICASSCEGTPNPVLEAMACGVPVISTDVGIVPDVFGPLQKQFILSNRSFSCLADKIKELLADKKNFIELSKENLIQIKSWDWKEKVKAFDEWFDSFDKI